ncbi:PDDEXK nuclease domain-containing protein [uncultured Parabacteroides sp.]|uniref:PDDEXK nuclease domain-containing protein n=1 Tax=uncultured Parabacteroides sp. TaxID=512312 RepID=UPI0025DD4222|nr:PDDEXK nuclease domain-containing protein [uncultured Parabacteroides sp.]
MDNNSLETKYTIAVQIIKTAILQSQYEAVKIINKEQLALYYGIGRYISQNSRNRYWGTSAISFISNKLQMELPGLRGFSERNLKNMRTFYEEWQLLDTNSAVTTAEIQSDKNDNDCITKIRQLQLPDFKDFPIEEFFKVSFTHHTAILSQVKTLEERYFYIKLCANELLKVDTLKKLMKEDIYHNQGSYPNNFMTKLPTAEFARRAILTFKDEYMLDFINVEELGARDIEDVDERIVENKIVQNIKNFIMTFGRDFTFVGNQFRVEALGHTHIIDLLFFNRELSSLVAIELKTGPFKTAYLGQLNMYLRILDDFVRKPNENQSIGIILCKSADKAYVEYAVRDYDKPMGVVTYKTVTDMPERLRNALPDMEELKKLL